MPFTKGHIGYNKGKHISEETRRKMSIAHKNTYENGRMPWFKGKHLTEEHKLNLSKSHKGKPSSLKGHKISQEHKDKIAFANKGRKHTPETREHLSKSLRERHRKVVSGRRSQGLLRYYQSHEVWNRDYHGLRK